MSKNVVVVGAQWGDEGKGKVVDWLTERVDGVVRFNGGHNAGHTLVINGAKTILRLIRRALCIRHLVAISVTASYFLPKLFSLKSKNSRATGWMQNRAFAFRATLL